MAKMNIILPAMGEGIIEATINKWLVAEGSVVKVGEVIAVIGTSITENPEIKGKIDKEVNMRRKTIR